jgi:ribosomal protein S18 acetylase RimI-like enzyme
MSHALERTVVDCPCLIRTVRQADLAMLSDLLASSFHSQEGWGRWLYPLLRAGIYEDLKSRLHGRSAHYACLVAVKPVMRGQMNPEVLGVLVGKGDMLVGTVELSLKTPSLLQPWNNKYLYISNLAVRAEYRHQGVAQQLLKTCERIALDWGFSGLYLHVLENNSAAQRLYDKAGYRLRRIELSPLALLLGHPRQLFLHKHLTRST